MTQPARFLLGTLAVVLLVCGWCALLVAVPLTALPAVVLGGVLGIIAVARALDRWVDQ